LQHQLLHGKWLTKLAWAKKMAALEPRSSVLANRGPMPTPSRMMHRVSLHRDPAGKFVKPLLLHFG
jgi:hypothetical protein